MRFRLAIAAACTFASSLASGSQAMEPKRGAILYPNSERQNIVETHFGIEVADPYRWLEADVRVNPKVKAWVDAQNAVTKNYIGDLPSRSAFASRMRELFNYERFDNPKKAGSRYFYFRNSGLQNQSVLYVREGLNGDARVLIDPNGWSVDGATALSDWEPSGDGRYVLYSVQDGGTDWRILRIVDVNTGQLFDDEVKWAKFTDLAWAKDGSGFFYSRFDEPKAEEQYQTIALNHRIYFHRLGANQSDDQLIFARPHQPDVVNYAETSTDGKWLIVSSAKSTDDRYEITLIDLTTPNLSSRTLIRGFENNWVFLGNSGNIFYWATNRDAPRLRIVSTDITTRELSIKELVAEDKATLESASIVGKQLIASYLVDAKTEVRTFTLDGKPIGKIALPGIGTAYGFEGDIDDRETFFAFTSFNYPTTIFRYDSVTGAVAEWTRPKVKFSPEDIVVSQHFYRSKDGTRVPMFVAHRRDLDLSKTHPTILYGYGGFYLPQLPSFSVPLLTWMEKGGVYALANIRGGAEYGKAWHDAGRLHNKQNVFDDFIAAAEFLIAEGISSNKQIAIMGGSNGGTLVGAVTNQRPDLFSAAVPAVGVMDMLRYDQFTVGRRWVDDYGYPEREADFRVLLSYSPYHNIRSGVPYPAVLAMTADTDDRVVPAHSFKYIAALQAADTGSAPKIIRIETRAGHGPGKPIDKVIEENSDMLAFIAYHSGMNVK